MTTTTNRRILAILQLALLPLVAGCSVLGFSPYPVAHVMTNDTKAVLEQTRNRLDVARELAKEVQVAHYIQPGDELLVETVSSEVDVRLPADQQVLADGTIDLGKFGRAVVASMTLEQAEALVQRMLAEQSGKSIEVNVRMIEPIHRYYVIGEVNSPGAYSLTGHETVLDAIMEAGGLTPRASACDLLLARPTDPCSCRVTLPVCYRAITQLGDTTTNYHLQPGDRIFVARQSMCEEMTAFLIGGRTCERCCNQQSACRNPRVASADLPNFRPPVVESITPTAPPKSDTEALPAELEPQRGGMSEPEPLPELNQPSSGLDGELDFGMLLR